MRFLVALLFISLSTVRAFGQDAYGKVELAPREWGTYQTRIKGEEAVRWRADWTLERVEEGPPEKYHIRHLAEGLYGYENNKERRLTEANFLLHENGSMEILDSCFTIWDSDGRKIRVLDKLHRPGESVVETKLFSPLTGITELREFEMAGDVVDAKQIVTYLRGFPFRSSGELEFGLLREKPDILSLYATYEGREEIETPAGTFSCHKVRMLPDLGIFTFLGRVFAPYFYMWFTVEPPHFWVRYMGPEGKVQSPYIISELVEYHTSSGE